MQKMTISYQWKESAHFHSQAFFLQSLVTLTVEDPSEADPVLPLNAPPLSTNAVRRNEPMEMIRILCDIAPPFQQSRRFIQGVSK
jgi:hypothetical protein